MKQFVENKFPFRFPIHLQYFTEGGEGGGGEGGGNDPGDDDGDNKNQPFAIFKTKEEFNKRLSRAERKGQSELAKELGFDSVEAMKEALANKNKASENNDGDKKADVDKIIEDKLKAEREKSFKRLVTAEVKVIANELGFADWEDAYALADLSEVKEDEKGNIVGVKEALEELAKKKPHLLKQQTQQRSGKFGANIPPNNKANSGKKLEEVANLAKSRGITTSKDVHDPWKR